MKFILVLYIILLEQKLINTDNETFTNTESVIFHETVAITETAAVIETNRDNETIAFTETIADTETISVTETDPTNTTVTNDKDTTKSTNTTVTIRSIRNFTYPTTNMNSVIEDVRQAGEDLVCRLQPISYDCHHGGLQYRYYWDIKLNACRESSMGILCTANLNSFAKLSHCDRTCRDWAVPDIRTPRLGPNVSCRLQPDFGQCDGYYPRFYFSVSHRRCKGFSYSGCAGNENRFNSFQLCATYCTPYIDEY